MVTVSELPVQSPSTTPDKPTEVSPQPSLPQQTPAREGPILFSEAPQQQSVPWAVDSSQCLVSSARQFGDLSTFRPEDSFLSSDAVACLTGDRQECERLKKELPPSAKVVGAENPSQGLDGAERLAQIFDSIEREDGLAYFVYDPSLSIQGKPVIAAEFQGDIITGKVHLSANSPLNSILAGLKPNDGYVILALPKEVASATVSSEPAMSRDGSNSFRLNYESAGFSMMVDTAVRSTSSIRDAEMWKDLIIGVTDLPAMVVAPRTTPEVVGKPSAPSRRYVYRPRTSESELESAASTKRLPLSVAGRSLGRRNLRRLESSNAFTNPSLPKREGQAPGEPILLSMSLFGLGARRQSAAKEAKVEIKPDTQRFVIGREASSPTAPKPDYPLDGAHVSRREAVIMRSPEGFNCTHLNKYTTLRLTDTTTGREIELKGEQSALIPPGNYSARIIGESATAASKAVDIPVVSRSGRQTPKQGSVRIVSSASKVQDEFSLTIPELAPSLNGQPLAKSNIINLGESTAAGSNPSPLRDLHLTNGNGRWNLGYTGKGIVKITSANGRSFTLETKKDVTHAKPGDAGLWATIPNQDLSPGAYTIEISGQRFDLVLPVRSQPASTPRATPEAPPVAESSKAGSDRSAAPRQAFTPDFLQRIQGQNKAVLLSKDFEQALSGTVMGKFQDGNSHVRAIVRRDTGAISLPPASGTVNPSEYTHISLQVNVRTQTVEKVTVGGPISPVARYNLGLLNGFKLKP